MDIRQLRYFVAIAETGQITAAARRLKMAQPPLSQQLKVMEQELGVVLFERGKHQMSLTREGVFLYQRAQDVIRMFDESIKDVRDIGQEIGGTLSIGSTLYSAPMLLERLIQYQTSYPKLTYKLWEGEPCHLNNLLEERQIEIALTNHPTQMKNVHTIRVHRDPFVFVAPKQWNLNRGESIDLREVVLRPLIVLGPVTGVGMYDGILHELHKYDGRPHIVCECHDATMLFHLVSKGFGATVVPLSLSTLLSPTDIDVLRLTGTNLSYEPVVMWRKNSHLSKAARVFLTSFDAFDLVKEQQSES